MVITLNGYNEMNIFEEGYKEIFNHSPIAKLILSVATPDFTILDANNTYLQATNTKKEELIGKPVFTVFPKNTLDPESKNIEQTLLSFEQVIQTRQPHTMEKYRYDIPVPGEDQFIEKYWITVNTPIFDAKGDIQFIIHAPRDVTAHHYLEKREKAGIESLKLQRKQLYATFMQAPVGIGIFKGPDLTVTMINHALCNIYGKSIKEMLGNPVFDVLPFVKGQGFEELVDNVRVTGETFEGIGVELPLIRNGILEKVYVDFVFEPFYEENNTITGVIVVATEVTAKVEAMHKLEEAEERARLAADAVDLGVYDLNIVNGNLVTSDRFAHIFGLEKPATSHEYNAALHPDDVEVRKKAQEDAIENGTMNYEARIIWPDQSIRWIKVEGKVLYDKEGNPARILGTVLDTTSQKFDKEQQRKLVTLVDNSVDLMSIFDLEGNNTYMNTAGIELLGLPSMAENQTIHLSDLHSPEYFEFVQNEVLPAVMREGSWSGRLMVRNYTTGENLPVFNNFIRIEESVTLKPIGIGVVMRDLRLELTAKQALADSESLLRNITTAAPTALWMSNKKGEITYINQTWVDWSGNSFEDNLLYGWMSIILPEDLTQVVDGFYKATSNKIQYEVEFRINHADGTQHWCIARGQPQFDLDGWLSGYIGSCTDITEHKALQNQKDNFIGIASHELKTPVTSLKGYAQVLERILKKKGHETEADMMRKMDAQLNRLTSLIGDLLDVTKINAGKLQFNNQVFELQPMVSELMQDLQRSTEKHLLVENFKPTGKTYADKERIEQVIINFLTNAIKYSPNPSKIIVHIEQRNNEIIVCVEDFGIGISSEDSMKVFEQFYRVSGAMQHTFPGLGLGLYISAEIIRRVGGRIWVESKQKEGSCFYFSLPVYQ
ncbi:PAS domain S-box protein [Pedobacter immunditicola]|uniref:PAS domain S-box protein n=1 Tax=Pedobacter immunditicola TaxID=3133440 RepID=UPI0030B18FD9